MEYRRFCTFGLVFFPKESESTAAKAAYPRSVAETSSAMMNHRTPKASSFCFYGWPPIKKRSAIICFCHFLATELGVKATPREVPFLVEGASEEGLIARALGQSIFTEADTWEDLKESIQDAVRCHFEEDQMPTHVRLHLVRQEVLAM